MRIFGTGFRGPVRVFFDVQQQQAIEAIIVGRTDTQIDIITPSVNLVGGQQLVATIHVITAAGTDFEQRLTLLNGFTFRKEILTPRVVTLSPNSGSVLGGYRVTIFGDGFQSPVKATVFTDGAVVETEVRVINVEFDQIVIQMPAANEVRTFAGQPVHVRVRNIFSETEAVLRNAFRYRAKMEIASISPNIGPADGGTDLRITGTGFESPSIVNVGDVPAQVLRISGTEIVARTGRLETTSCADTAAAVRVIDINTGDVAEGPAFTYVPSRPVILDVAPRIAEVGSIVEVGVVNFNGMNAMVSLGGEPFFAPVSGSKLTFIVPESLPFPRTPCTIEGIDGTGPTAFVADLTITDAAGCTTVLPAAITVLPAANALCTIPPSAQVVAPDEGHCLRFGRNRPRSRTISIRNRDDLPGRTPLYVTGMSLAGPAAAEFDLALASPNAFAESGETVDFVVTFKGEIEGYRTARAMFHTNDPERPVVAVCLSGFRY